MSYPFGSKQLRQFSVELMVFCALGFQYNMLKTLQCHHLHTQKDCFFPEGLELVYCMHFFSIVNVSILTCIFRLIEPSLGISYGLFKERENRRFKLAPQFCGL